MRLSDLRLAIAAVPSLRRVQIGYRGAYAVWALREIVASVKRGEAVAL